MTSELIIEEIAKEKIKFLHFPKVDVLQFPHEIEARTKNIRKALSLGNNDHQKVKIIFRDIDGIKQVETTIWGLTDEDAILKQGTNLPIHAITKVILL